MSSAGWLALWKSALALVATEPVAVQIATGLGAAFFVVMFLEGVFASFRPGRYAVLLARKYQTVTLTAPPVEVAAAPADAIALPAYDAPPAPTRPARPMRPPRPNRKRAMVSIRRQRPTRPKIQRMVNSDACATGVPPEN